MAITHIFLIRLSETGRLDNSFGDNGVKEYHFIQQNYETPEAMKIDRAGRILVVGSGVNFDDDSDSAVTFRCLQDGSIDTEFGGIGFRVDQHNQSITTGCDLVLDQGGGIIVVTCPYYMGSYPSVGLIRYNESGFLSSVFGNGAGKVSLRIPGTTMTVPEAGGITEEGKIVVAGFVGTQAGKDLVMLARFDSAGNQDVTFGDNGVVVREFFPSALRERAYEMSIDSQGRIVVAGVVEHEPGAYRIFAARYLENGSLDSTFADAGVKSISFEGSSLQHTAGVTTIKKTIHLPPRRRTRRRPSRPPWRLKVGSSSKPVGPVKWWKDSPGTVSAGSRTENPVLIAGTVIGPDGKHRFAMVQLQENGDPDPAFGEGGYVVTDFAESVFVSASDMHRAHRIVLAGQVEGTDLTTRIGVVQYRLNGDLDEDFGENGRVVSTPVPHPSHSPHQYADAVRFDNSGRIVVAGTKF